MVNEILEKLTLDEKLRLLCGVGSWHTFDCNGKLPKFMMTDGPHGLRKQDFEEYGDINKSAVATCFPTASAVASSWNVKSVQKMAKAIAAEAKKEKVSMVLGCGTNIKRAPMCGRNFEYFSEDPYLAGSFATNYINAMQEEGVGTSLKHFACNNQETMRQTSNSSVDERALFEIYLKAFEMTVKGAQPSTIMGSYNRINGTYSCNNPYLLNDILREKWGFKGAMISDWGATMNVVEAIKAGLDLEMPDSYGYHTNQLKEAYERGELTIEEIDKAAGRIINLVQTYACDDTEYSVSYENHNEIACDIECDSAVLLQHKKAYPVKSGEKILILGSMASTMRFQGGGSSHITTIRTKSALEALKERNLNITYMEEPAGDLSAYDKILYFCGLTDKLESEGYDRPSLTLPKNQIKVIEDLTAKYSNVSLVTFGGSPFVIPCRDNLNDILHMHLGGQAVGEATARLLTGEVVPSGKLSETYPLSVEDTPCFGFWGKRSNNVPYVESIFVGYRFYETFNVPVEYEFGYGLSYTTFEYSDLTVEDKGDIFDITYTIKNTGDYDASEVSELYIINPEANYMRSVIELKGFSKDFIKSGDSVKVNIQLKKDEFSIYDVEIHDFVRVAGNYEIAVGSSVRNLHLRKKVMLDGKTIILNQKSSLKSYFVPDRGEERVQFNLKEFKILHGGKIEDFDDFSNRPYTIYDSMETVCNASLIGKIVLNTLVFVLGKTIKAPKDDPSYLMVICGMKEAPLDSLIGISNGMIKPNFANWLVKMANK